MTPYYAKVAAPRSAPPRVKISAGPAVIVDARSAPAAAPPPVAAPAPVKRTHLLEHPLAQQSLSLLRNRETQAPQFRQACNQLLVLLLIEATRGLRVREQSVETAHGSAPGQTLARPVVVLSVARHGLGLAHQAAGLLSPLLVGLVSLDRSADGGSLEPRLHLANTPALGDASVILFDPVVASGNSAQLALTLARRAGATDIALVSFLVSLPGLSRLQSASPDLQVWTAGIDAELDPKRGPLPGLGNVAQRLYG